MMMMIIFKSLSLHNNMAPNLILINYENPSISKIDTRLALLLSHAMYSHFYVTNNQSIIAD